MSHLFYMLLVAVLLILSFFPVYILNSFILWTQIVFRYYLQKRNTNWEIVYGLYANRFISNQNIFSFLYNIVGEQEAFHNFYFDCFNVICLVESKNRLCFQKLGYGLHNFPYTQPSCKCSLLNYSFYDTYISANPLKN